LLADAAESPLRCSIRSRSDVATHNGPAKKCRLG
jgi:hypothetical protein